MFFTNKNQNGGLGAKRINIDSYTITSIYMNQVQQEQCSFEKELWLLDPITNFQISSIGRYKSSKINSQEIKTGNSINPKKGIHYQLDYLVATLYLNYNPELHFLEIIDKNAEYKNSVNNLILIDRILPGEQWMPIKDHQNYYCSNIGRVYSNSKKHARLLKPDIGEHDYHRFTLKNNNGKLVRWLAHRLVYSTFNQDEDIADLVINHLDSDRSNNRIDNLESCTQKQNVDYSYIYGNNAVLLGKIDKPYNPMLSVGSRKMVDTTGFRM